MGQNKEQGSFPWFRLLFTGSVAAGFAAFLWFLDAQPPQAPEASNTSTQKAPVSPSKPASPEAPAPAKEKYSFYEFLTGKEVFQPEPEEVAKPRPVAPKPVEKPKPQPKPVTEKPPAKPITYWLQIASLGSAIDADGLKARLLLMGYDVDIQSVVVKSKARHRVRVGPFSSTQAMDSQKARLTLDGFQPVLVKE